MVAMRQWAVEFERDTNPSPLTLRSIEAAKAIGRVNGWGSRLEAIVEALDSDAVEAMVLDLWPTARIERVTAL